MFRFIFGFSMNGNMQVSDWLVELLHTTYELNENAYRLGEQETGSNEDNSGSTPQTTQI